MMENNETTGKPRVTKGSGAVSSEDSVWNSIDWPKCRSIVSRLQARIVKATKEGRWGKVKALQHLLTHSFSGRALAVKRVTDNRGGRTPGVDGVTWRTPDRKAQAVQELRQEGYRPQPLRRLYIEKPGTTKTRPLGIPVMKCRAMQALYLQALAPIAETTGDDSSYGFRPERSTADAIGRCFVTLAQRRSAPWILEGDIQSCFDQISHEWLLENIPMDRSMLHKWLKAGYIDKSVFYETEEGTPQGGVISPVIANMALDGLKPMLRKAFPVHSRQQVNVVRFADDFIVTGRTKELLEERVKPLIESFMRERGLHLSPTKTIITHIDTGFDFLGMNLRKYNGKLLIKPSKKNLSAFLRKTRKFIREHKTITAGVMVAKLNPMIRGWANYHRHTVSSRAFSYVDHQIWKALWQWAKRRHPNKNRRWIKNKYFPAYQGRRWVFSGQITDTEGKKRALRLFLAATTGIRRHVQIIAEANPFDPEWQAHFRLRRERARREAYHHRHRDRRGLLTRLSEPPSFIRAPTPPVLSPCPRTGADVEARAVLRETGMAGSKGRGRR